MRTVTFKWKCKNSRDLGKHEKDYKFLSNPRYSARSTQSGQWGPSHQIPGPEDKELTAPDPPLSTNVLTSGDVSLFFKRFEDYSVDLYLNEPELALTINELCTSALELVRHCCFQKLAQKETRMKYELFLRCTSNGSTWNSRTERIEKLASQMRFSNYVHRLLLCYVHEEGWKTATWPVLLQEAYSARCEEEHFVAV